MRAVVILAALVACYEPDLETCAVACGPNDPCPNGLTCGDDLHCHGDDDATCGFELLVTLDDPSGIMEGQIIGVDGLSCPPACSTTMVGGSSVVLSGAATKHNLITFDGACTGRDCSFEAKSDLEVIAHIAQGRFVVVRVAGDGPGSVKSELDEISCSGGPLDPCRAVFAPDVPIVLDAKPGDPAVFQGWGGVPECDSTSRCTIPPGVDDVQVTGTFDVNKLVVAPVGIGSIDDTIDVFVDTMLQKSCSSTCEVLFSPTTSTDVVLRPSVVNDVTRKFARWVDPACASSPNPIFPDCSLAVTGDQVVIGLFEPRPLVTLHVGKSGTITGTSVPAFCPGGICIGADPLATYEAHFDLSTLVQLKAVADDSQTNQPTWQGCPGQGASQVHDPVCSFSLVNDADITVTFGAIPVGGT